MIPSFSKKLSKITSNLFNQCYFILENAIKRTNKLIENLEQELTNIKFNDFSYQNSIIDKNFNELDDLENYLNSTFIIY